MKKSRFGLFLDTENSIEAVLQCFCSFGCVAGQDMTIDSEGIHLSGISDDGFHHSLRQGFGDEKTLERELKPLDSISDHNPKYLLTMDNDPPISHNGIRQKYALGWLLGK